MSNEYLRRLSNSFQDVRLVSLASWRQANEVQPRDRNGPYLVTQTGYDPQDAKMTGDEFILGRSGQWLSLSHFFKLPVPDRREEFVFGTAAEVMLAMRDLPSNAVVMRPGAQTHSAPGAAEQDDMAEAFQKSRDQGPEGEKA